MKSIKVREWNIHGAAALPWNNGYEIEPWIVNTITDGLPECIVLTEFVVAKGFGYLQSKLEEKGYIWFLNAASASNGILIAVNKSCGFDYSDICSYKSGFVIGSEILTGADVPDFYEIRVKNNRSMLSIIGVRIRKDLNARNQAFVHSQFEAIDNYLSSLKHDVICVGDFNAYWPGIWKTVRNITLSKTSQTFSLYTPPYNKGDWYSFVQPNGDKNQLDHLITNIDSNIRVYYNWDFVSGENGYGNLSKSSYKKLSGKPDHAILEAEIEL